MTDKSINGVKQLVVGTDQSEVLSFEIEFTRQNNYDSIDLSKINAWLFGHQDYKRLQILQNDMPNIYYNCFLTNPTILKYNGQAHGVRCTVVCDAPWAWENPRQIIKRFETTSPNVFDFFNYSDNNANMYPIVSFTLTDHNTDFTIINHSMQDLRFEWKGLLGGETITVDNETQVILSSTKLHRINKFNKTFLKFKKGLNKLECIGTVKELKITYQNARKVGG